MSRRVTITGATGYLGHALLKELAASGYHLSLLVREEKRLPEDRPPDARIHQGSLEDAAVLREAMEGAEAVFHLAGAVAEWLPDPAEFERANVEGTALVLDAARDAGVPVVVATSTVLVLGHSDGLEAARETTTRPWGASRLPYQRTKAEALRLCREERLRGRDIRVAFPGALYGPGPLTSGNYLGGILDDLLHGRLPALPRTPGLRCCMSHTSDVARGHRLLLERGVRGGEYILGGDNIPLDQLFDAMREGLRLDRLPPRLPKPLLLSGLAILNLLSALAGRAPVMTVAGGRSLLHSWAFSSERARRDLGYTWRSFEEAFPEFVEEVGRRLASREGSTQRRGGAETI